MLLGYLDHVDGFIISGWARDTEDPERRVRLELYDGDRLVTRLVADRLRPDLAASGVGDGRYGFWMPLPRDMFPNSVHVLSVRFADDGTDLRNSPRPLHANGGGIDAAFEGWFTRHVDAAAAAAAEPADLAPLYAMVTNALARLMRAEGALAEAASHVPIAVRERAHLPVHLKTALERVATTCPPLHVPIVRDPSLSIIVAGNGTLKESWQCLASIVASRGLGSYEIIFVDVTGSADMVLAPFIVGGGIRFLKTPRPAPVLDAYRLGLGLAAGKRLLFLGRIATVEPDAIAALAATLDTADGEAIVSPRLLTADDRILEAGARFSAMAARVPIGRLEPAGSTRHRILRESDDVSPRAFMVDRTVLDSVGGFDGIDDYGELGMADIAFRLRERGAAVLAQGFAAMMVAGAGDVARENRRGRANFAARWEHVLPPAGGETAVSIPLRALVIDEHVPDPNRDAASVALISHCESLRRLGYAVEFVPHIRAGGSSDGGASLFMRGIEAHADADGAASLLRERAGQFDLIYLHRLSVARDLLPVCRMTQPAARIVYSIADLHFQRQRRMAEVEGNAAALSESEITEQQERACMLAADRVVTHSHEEAAWIGAELPAVKAGRVLWSYPIASEVAPFAARRNVCILGTYGHAPNVDAVRHFAGTLWPLVRARLPDVDLEIAGSHLERGEFDFSVPGLLPRGYVADAGAYLDGTRVMLAPLRYGAGVKGKVLLSFARGLPCVMTGIAAEGLGLPRAIQELLVATDDEAFVRKAIRFYTDEAIWMRASGLIRDWAAENLSPGAIDRGLAALLGELAPAQRSVTAEQRRVA